MTAIQNMLDPLCKAEAAFLGAQERWMMGHSGQETDDVGDTNGQGKPLKHGLVVGRITKIHIPFEVLFEPFIIPVAYELNAPRPLIKIAIPPVDVNGGHLADGTGVLELTHYGIDGCFWKSGDILTKVDGEVQLAIGLVRSEGGARRICYWRWRCGIPGESTGGWLVR